MTGIIEMLNAGWALVPVPKGLKGPKTANWNLPENCVIGACTQDVLDRLEGMNIGLAHAYCTPTPTCAIDVDNYKQAKMWLQSHGIDSNDLLFNEAARVIWSGKKYSLKLLYRLPEGVKPLESKKIVGPDGKSILEFRCATKDGKTVQDILPPSLHPEGHQYQWLEQKNPVDLPVIPPALLEVWTNQLYKTPRVPWRSGIGVALRASSREETPRQVAIIREALSFIDADCGYETWRNVVWSVMSTKWACAEELAKAWSMTAPQAYDEAAFCRLVGSYLEDRATPLTLGTAYHHARKGGWHGRY